MTNPSIPPQLTQIANSLASTENQIQTALKAIQLVLSNVRSEAETIRMLAQQLEQQTPEE
ncbi:MAG: hypothetical protein QNJ46_01700 [Leptolyngbyaceae cyanobacterium MO_188.B28]|nr:hypothetical protein [Leptolyngbyaceae cyanobacterium MO_188.B28]